MSKEKTGPQVQVRMLVGMACETNDRDAGKIVSVGADEAGRLIEKGFAEKVAGKAKAAGDGE